MLSKSWHCQDWLDPPSLYPNPGTRLERYIVTNASLYQLYQWLSWYHSINGNGTHVSSSVTVVNHWSPKLENHRKPSLLMVIPPKTVNGDGEKFSKPSQFHRCQNKTITIPSPQKIDHGSSLHGTLVDLTTKAHKCGS